jgi:glucan 1,3-beta-glucosidase
MRKTIPPAGRKSMSFWLHDTFTDLSQWAGQFLPPKFLDVVMDSHFYVIFDPNPLTRNAAPLCHAYKACQYKGYPGAEYSKNNLPLVFGEWSGALTDCGLYVNGMNELI